MERGLHQLRPIRALAARQRDARRLMAGDQRRNHHICQRLGDAARGVLRARTIAPEQAGSVHRERKFALSRVKQQGFADRKDRADGQRLQSALPAFRETCIKRSDPARAALIGCAAGDALCVQRGSKIFFQREGRGLPGGIVATGRHHKAAHMDVARRNDDDCGRDGNAGGQYECVQTLASSQHIAKGAA